jgi:hypothetical protein
MNLRTLKFSDNLQTIYGVQPLCVSSAWTRRR